MQRAYEVYGHATGLPSPLLENAALYWQSKSTYRDRAEVIGVARNFSQRNLSVGMIVIAHDENLMWRGPQNLRKTLASRFSGSLNARHVSIGSGPVGQGLPMIIVVQL